MCTPSATTAIDPKIVPPTISMTIMAAVSATTDQVRRSCCSCFSPRNTCGWRHGSIECECIAYSQVPASNRQRVVPPSLVDAIARRLRPSLPLPAPCGRRSVLLIWRGWRHAPSAEMPFAGRAGAIE
jgi:hypothetical protein